MVLVNRTNTPITIDGIVYEAWNTASPIVINWWGEDNEIPNSVDFEASYKLLWDDYFVYFLGTIHDVLMDKGACADLVVADWHL